MMAVFHEIGFPPNRHKPRSQILKRMQIVIAWNLTGQTFPCRKHSRNANITEKWIWGCVMWRWFWKLVASDCRTHKPLYHPRCFRKTLKRDWTHGEKKLLFVLQDSSDIMHRLTAVTAIFWLFVRYSRRHNQTVLWMHTIGKKQQQTDQLINFQ